ncbi:hypothetical protein V8C86DRAFT_2953304 [Haematococcus lacustris]
MRWPVQYISLFHCILILLYSCLLVLQEVTGSNPFIESLLSRRKVSHLGWHVNMVQCSRSQARITHKVGSMLEYQRITGWVKWWVRCLRCSGPRPGPQLMLMTCTVVFK